MRSEAEVSDHYTHGGLLDAVRAALHQIGKTVENVKVEDLAGIDEFHIGGRPASVESAVGLSFMKPPFYFGVWRIFFYFY